MIRSVAHPKGRNWHKEHRARAKRAWAIVAIIAIIALALAALGYFTGVSWTTLGIALAHSTYRLAVGYVLGLIMGAGIALIVGWSPFAGGLFPVFDVLQNVPSFALLPIFAVLMGYTDLMIIIFVASSIMWPILFAVLTAIKTAHPDLNDAATIFGANGAKRVRYYLAPLAFPAILTGSIVGIALGWESVIGAEIIGRAGGIGGFMSTAGEAGVSPALFAGVIGILIVVFIVNRLVWAPLLASSTKYYAE